MESLTRNFLKRFQRSNFIFSGHIFQPNITNKFPSTTLMFPLRQTIPSEAVSTMCRSSPHSAPGHRLMGTVCVCVTDFLSSSECFKLNVNMIWMPVGLYELGECGACVLLRICNNLMIERWNEAVKARGVSCTTLQYKAWQIWLFLVSWNRFHGVQLTGFFSSSLHLVCITSRAG